MTLILSVVSQKGGVGKSTISRAIAEFSTREGLKTLLADLDYSQQTSYNWSIRRERHTERKQVETKAFQNYQDALDASKNYEIIILDTKGYTDEQTAEICKKSDIVILPCGFSLDEREPTFITLNTLVKIGVSKKALNVVLLGDHTRPREREARNYFAKGGYHVVEGILRKKIIYEKALDDGLSVTEASKQQYRDEALTLVEAISKRLEVVL